jgi:DNA primase|tara:strand:+ start:159 stop:2087 length:1929 start_codon:yes stop_codon:yes gene_type:complete
LIPKETIDLIFETARIDEVVGDFVHLKKRGVNMLGNCPFHDEKTPSFTVSPAKGIYKCFGCGKGGNSVNFVMDHEHFSYPEALKFLASKYNIFIEEQERTPEQEEAANDRESMYIVSNSANEYFQDQLFNGDEGRAIGLSYFKERGFREDTLKKFQLGYSPEKSDAFSAHALKEGYKIEFLEKTGLTIPKESRNYDRFRGRVMFPIHSLSGRILGFGGRILKSNVKAAKYLNSPESEIYSKSKVLYGMYQAKNSIVKKERCLLVEGYTDVVSMHQAGIENVVASSGTSLTVDQIKLVKRFTNNITLLFDGDAAGLKAALRGVNLILQEGLNVKVVTFPDGEDPDSYAKKVSSEELENYIDSQAKDFIEFKCSLLLAEAKEDPIKRAELIKDIAATIALIPDTISRTVYAQSSSSILGIDEQLIFSSIEQSRSGKTPVAKSEAMQVVFTGTKKASKVEALTLSLEETTLIRLLVIYGTSPLNFEYENEEGEEEVTTVSAAEYILSQLDEDGIEFTHTAYNKIYTEFVNHVNEHETILDDKHFVRHQDPEISQAVSELLSDKYQLSDWSKKEIFVPTETDKLKELVVESVIRLKSKQVKIKIADMLKQMKDNTVPEEDRLNFLHNFQQLNNLSMHIDKELGREC